MVKRTNRILNLNRMISEYKREQEKFEIIQQEIDNQQRDIEDLRLLILSTNFQDHNTSTKSSTSTTSTIDTLNCKGSKSKMKTNSKNTDDLKKRQDKISQKSNEKLEQSSNDQITSSKMKVLQNDDDSNSSSNHLEEKTTNRKKLDTLSNHRSKGLQTISKNVLNQKDNKYLTTMHVIDKAGDQKMISTLVASSKDADLNSQHLNKQSNERSARITSNELMKKITKLTNNKFENQENPVKEWLGVNKISKSITKKTRPLMKSALKSSTKLTSSNRFN